MDEKQKELVIRFIQDIEMKTAVFEALKEQLDFETIVRANTPTEKSDELLGQVTRGIVTGLRLLDKAFASVEELFQPEVEPKGEEENTAM